MSLPLVPAILASIALITDLTEAKPAIDENIEKRSQSFLNSVTTSKKTTTTKKSSTKKSSTKKSTTTTKKSITTKAASTSVATTSLAVSPSSVNPIILSSYSSGVLAASTSTSSSSITVSASSSPTQSASKSSGSLSGGAIGAIVAVVVIVIAGAAAYLIISKRRKNRAGKTRAVTKPDPFTMGFGSDGGFQTYNNQPPMQINSPVQTNNYQQYNQQYSQPNMAVVSPTLPSSPYYPNSASNTQFHDANNHIIAESMMPTIISQNQYQPQLQPQPGSENHLSNVSTTARMPPTQAGSIGVFFVVATYTPTLNDEIDIQINDQVELIVEYDDGWCQGINLTRGHAKGVFPRHCIENGNNGNNINDVDRLKRVSSMYMG